MSVLQLPPRTDMEDLLLGRIARKDVRAFEALYNRFSGRVYALALKIVHDSQLAEDVVQEVFLEAWRAAGHFDPGRGSARSWLLSMAHHKSVDTFRQRRRRTHEILSPTLVAETDVTQDALRAVESLRVRRALATLTDGQRESIIWAYYGGYTQREIALRLRMPVGTVKTRMRDGMGRLRAALAPEVEETA